MCADRLALYTTIYPGVEPYLQEWYRSVAEQTDREFDLWIGVDSLTPAAIAASLDADPGARWVCLAPGATPAQIRTEAIGRMVERHSAVVFVDSDDVLHRTRVAAARRMLAEADVTGCALDVMDASGRDAGIVFRAPDGSDPVTLLPRYNVFGLSNTAYRSTALRQCLPLPDDCVLVDWFMATRAWAGGATFRFDATPQMRYRQHPANVAPVLPPFSPRQISTATGQVLDHYRFVLDGDRELPAPCRAVLERERQRVAAFDNAMRQRPRALDAYASQLNRLPPMRVWWWQVANPDLEYTWTS
jgi:hypothetical protein